jgi:hypothetical protein
LLEEEKLRWEPNDVLDDSRESSFLEEAYSYYIAALELKLEPVV